MLEISFFAPPPVAKWIRFNLWILTWFFVHSGCCSRGDLENPTKIFPIVSPIIVVTKRNKLTLVPGHVNQWFWRDFDSKFGGVLGYLRGLEGPKCKNKATFVTRIQKVVLVKVYLFFHFGHSKPLKQPKTPQILTQNHAKTTGSNDLGQMPNHFIY